MPTRLNFESDGEQPEDDPPKMIFSDVETNQENTNWVSEGRWSDSP